MKKLVFSLALVTSLVFVGCSGDDDGNEQTCATCNLLGVNVEACDNGNGTVTVTAAGETEVLSEEDLDGLTAAEYVAALEEGCGALSSQ